MPRVIFGDGRSPAFLPQRLEQLAAERPVGPTVAEPLPVPPAARPAVIAPPVAAPPAAAATATTMTAIPWPLSETPVTSIIGQVQPGWPTGLLFGIAGLLLAPIGGIWLGHRQARATKAASQLVGH